MGKTTPTTNRWNMNFNKNYPKHRKYRDSCHQKQTKTRKYRGFGVPRRKQHRYLRCCLLSEYEKAAKTPPIWRFSATMRMRKNCRGNNNNNNSSSNKKEKKEKKKQKNKNKHKDKKNKHKNATTRCVVRWLQAVAWKEHHTVLCTCAHAQSTWTTPTLTLLCITLMASPVCDTLQ